MRPHCTLPQLFQWRRPSPPNHKTQLYARSISIRAPLLHSPPPTNIPISLPNPETCDLAGALHLLSNVPNPTTFLWNTLIRACSRNHTPEESVHLYRHMRRRGSSPDHHTFRFLFKACGVSSAIREGWMIHCSFLKVFSHCGALVGNSLIHMYSQFGCLDAAWLVFDSVWDKDVVSWTTIVGGYAKSGFMGDARRLFDEMPVRNVVSWTSMVAGYAQTRQAAKAVEIFERMMSDNVKPDSVAMVSVLSACAQLRNLEFGRWVHRFAEKERIGISRNLVVSLIDMYSKCGDMEAACRVFDSTDRKILPAWNALIDGYCKLGDLGTARSLFDQMEDHDVISFNSMITGYVQTSNLKEALLLFAKFRALLLKPDKFTVVSMLAACASIGSQHIGKAVHAYIEVCSIQPDIFLGTALLDMYAKCGRIDQTMLVFSKMDEKDLLAWTAIISGLAIHGKGKLALQYFSLMQKEGIRPNGVAYIGVLSACSHSGLVEEGQMHFEEMQSLHKIDPEIEHYGCMVDLYGRGGFLKEAEELIKNMPMEPNAVIWGSLLAACRVYKDIGLATKAAKHLIALEPYEDAGYVQLYNIHANSGRWSDASAVRLMMEEKGVKKTAGCSSVTVDGKVHQFIAGDHSHPQLLEIQGMVDEMVKRLKLAGYVPVTSPVLSALDEEEKERALFGHSERMAIAFGIMKLGANLPIHVFKNLRICEDCHSAIKLIAEIWNRDIVVRDRSRFHHFKHGKCSCNDFW